MAFLTEDAVDVAVDVQHRTHLLVKWLGAALDDDRFVPEEAAGLSHRTSGALGWLERYYDNLPTDALVPRALLGQQAAFLTTVIDGTFELDMDPGDFRYSERAHCFCSMCSWMKRRPYLRPSKVREGDKKAADRLQVGQLRQLARDVDLDPEREPVKRLAGDRAYREELALFTYGVNLLERMDGRNRGAVPLALWRRFAWNEAG